MSTSVHGPPAEHTGAPTRLGSEAVTHGVRVVASPRYLPEDSDPARPHHVFAYTIRITNGSGAAVKLLSRRWRIVDANGGEETVTGDGVVGVQPRIGVGESFEYSSYCTLRTRWGTMEGEYTVLGEDGERRVRIARFYLASGA